MRRLFNLILIMLIITLSACGKQAGTESSKDMAAEQNGQTNNVETTEQTG